MYKTDSSTGFTAGGPLADPVDYALRHGLRGDAKALQKQSDAYVGVQRKVVNREDAARALLLSANMLSMSVMASQMNMYRWRVSEAQTISQATSILQDEVISATRKGYRVHRDRPKPTKVSKYADGKGLQKLYEKTTARLERRRQRREAREQRQQHQAGTSGAAAARGVAAAPGKRPERKAAAGDAEVDVESGRRKGRGGVFSFTSESDEDSSSSDGSGDAQSDGESECSNTCSAERYGKANETRRSSPAPPDAITRLVLVDSFTHEPFTDIIEHIRHIDHEYCLQLVVVLLLPVGDDANEMQGAGCVLSPEHQISINEAYTAGYDLVLTHYFDHVVVNFLTDTFVSSAGRWRNDVRSKAAVGNYISLKNVLLGRIDMEALRSLVWSETVDNAEILELIGAHSLALQGEAKRYTVAGQKLSKQATTNTGADVLVIESDGGEEEDSGAAEGLAQFQLDGMLLPAGLARLRSRETNQHGVRTSRPSFIPLEGLLAGNDVINGMMHPTNQVRHTVRRRRPGANSDDNDESAYEYVLVDESAENKGVLLDAIEVEMARLLADNDSKQALVTQLQSDLERMHKTVAVLQQQRAAQAARGRKEGATSLPQRPDSASLVNLTKEQQIYILKERLEQANDQIASLIEGGGGGVSSRSRNGIGTGGSNGTSKRVGANSSSRGHQLSKGTGLTAAARQLCRAYTEGREADLMGCYDMDARMVALYCGDGDGDGSGGGFGGSFHYANAGDAAEEVAVRRRERETADTVIANLERQLLHIQGRNWGADGPDVMTLSVKLTEALSLLTSQRQRIQQLEELRKMDDVLAKRKVQLAVEKALKKEEERARAAEATTKRPKKTGSVGGGNSVGKRPAAAAKSTALKKKSDSIADSGSAAQLAKVQATHEKELEALRAQLEAEGAGQREKAVEDVERRHRRENRERDKALKESLQRLYLRIRKPYTREYRALLKKEYSTATSNARGAERRLQFALTHLKPSQLRDVDEETGESVVGPVARIRDAVQRERVEGIAKECATYTMRAEKARLGIQEVDEANHSAAGQARLLMLVTERTRCVEAVEAARNSIDMPTYLSALKELAVAEESLARWGDIDIAGLLMESGGAPLVDPTAASASFAQSSPQLESVMGEDSFALPGASDRPAIEFRVSMPDSNGMLSELADLYRAATSQPSGDQPRMSLRHASRVTSAAVSDRLKSSGGPSRQHPTATGPTRVSTITTTEGAEVLRGHSGVVVDDGAMCAAHVELYQALLARYQAGFVHPDRMVDVERELTDGDDRTTAEPAWSSLYLEHHQELVRLLKVVAYRYPALGPVAQVTSKDIEEGLERALRHGDEAERTKIPFLVATDTALLTWVVEYLSTVIVQQIERNQSERSKEERAEDEALVKELTDRPLRNLSEADARLRAYASTWQEARHQQSSVFTDSVARRSAIPPPLPPRNLLNDGDVFLTSVANSEAGYTADDLAALFSARRPESVSSGSSLKPESLYLDLENADPNDAQTQLMRGIKAELDYLNALKKQRMEELVMQYRLRRREQAGGERNVYEGAGSDVGGAGPTHVPDFEVKEGSPAWYGMEAAKRVKDILRRRQKPDQVVLGAGGGAVGVELSRRTAFPKPPARSLSVVQSATLRLRAAHAALPPLKPSGMSHQRLQQLHHGRGYGDDGGGYVHPRDEVSVGAYDRVVSMYPPPGSLEDLYGRMGGGALNLGAMSNSVAERMLRYRATLARAASCMGTGNAEVARRLGPPYYLPVAVASSNGEGRLRPPSSSEQRAPPSVTAWTYGVPAEHVRELLDQPLDGGDTGDTVLFLPSRGQGGGGGGESARLPQSRGAWGARSRGAPYFGNATLMESGAGAYASPASMAAQRLTTMLRASMADPTVVSGLTGRSYPLNPHAAAGAKLSSVRAHSPSVPPPPTAGHPGNPRPPSGGSESITAGAAKRPAQHGSPSSPMSSPPLEGATDETLGNPPGVLSPFASTIPPQ